ncbi:tRNA (adenosine(37)-N6)-threonylcarbamoyltransferase complex dimerization subunit type 1 TsaB [Pedobacter sp. HDW13]|uniref:tRNA (adenosine(37)-N6)-threonylcarbamoyltransferase complex dimerization subunit type 1 TsaB n=1 Tax=unclassified Pedobacter TaxID=2628915 RepID=UPI000F5B2895|nr:MULTISPECIES: tRNA (adenosine(37)-N6)-threonylcarbamoyltransferase complex dimerization subunit type 1 TsaB [unclassified Pedobacter]QIL42477.1 tRNA (adenosine(37)-N6)-threonylcarbamoyltransferase complex dimerization subunit type 1 TsaB [Pedobacter sp. HDW13]RQO78957.1 tRNA (adenosine(37)-N6)-threonylcarbamoyltransferase complex dimerization subunit type 1 TsaB [Pedobacter sp. KBW01]
MAKILQIETATAVCSVALSVNGKTVSVKEEIGQNLHASKLTLFIDEVLRTAGVNYSELDAIAVSKGPGSYTGLRIGVSTAKGLCYALDKPLIAIETLKMMAAGFQSENPEYKGLICSMIDARRMEVYTSVFDITLDVLLPTEAKIIDETSFSDLLSINKVTFLGDGAAKCAAVLTHENAYFDAANFNAATYMSALAETAFQQRNFEDVAYFEPFYLKDFVVTQSKKQQAQP